MHQRLVNYIRSNRGPGIARISSRVAALVAMAVLLVPVVALPLRAGGGAPARANRDREVAVTFDDLPGVFGGGCERKTFEEVNGKIIGTLTTNKIPAIGLVNEGRNCAVQNGSLERVLKMWLDAGLDLGNHSFSHHDLNTTPLATYQADVLRGEVTTRKLLEERGRKIRYFRHPFLHAGRDIETKTAFEKFLVERGYRVAPVTIDNQEWVFADVYGRALKRGDIATARRIGETYVSYMEQIFDFFERLSTEVAGYEIKQVLLLHVNSLNGDYFDELVAMMRKRGYKFITLDEALQDQAYSLADTYTGARGLSWLHRWAISKGMKHKEEPAEPTWIKQMFDGR
jgi:peptidoglycan/xylan/chitin deacetylase (PgdA/CDA1 family)